MSISEPSLTRRQSAGLIAMYMLVAASLAYLQGQDMNWDLRNYHYYGPYMLWEDRIDLDVHAAGVQTFLNPALNLPLFFAIRAGVPPIVFGLALAAVHGIALWYVHRIAVMLMTGASPWIAHTAGALAATTAALGSGFRGEVGTTLGDTIIATVVLASVVRLLDVTPHQPHLRKASAIAGVLLGLAAGAKLVGGVFGPGLLCLVWMAGDSFRQRAACMSAFGLSVAAGVLVTGGPWMWVMHEHFGSPLFPFYNLVFRSEWASLRDFSTDYYAALPARQLPFSLPFRFLRGEFVAVEVPFRDARFAAAVVSLTAIAGLAAARYQLRRATTPSQTWKRLAMLAVFWIVSYVAWVHLIPLYRFALPLELLSGVLVLGAFVQVVGAHGRALVASAAICTVLVVWTKPLDYTHIPWSQDYFGVPRAELPEYAGATIVIADFPTAYLAPYFPSSTIFLRLLSNFGLESSRMLDRALMRLSLAPANRLFILHHLNSNDPRTEMVLDRLGFAIDVTRCRRFASYADNFAICPIARR